MRFLSKMLLKIMVVGVGLVVGFDVVCAMKVRRYSAAEPYEDRAANSVGVKTLLVTYINPAWRGAEKFDGEMEQAVEASVEGKGVATFHRTGPSDLKNEEAVAGEVERLGEFVEQQAKAGIQSIHFYTAGDGSALLAMLSNLLAGHLDSPRSPASRRLSHSASVSLATAAAADTFGHGRDEIFKESAASVLGGQRVRFADNEDDDSLAAASSRSNSPVKLPMRRVSVTGEQAKREELYAACTMGRSCNSGGSVEHRPKMRHDANRRVSVLSLRDPEIDAMLMSRYYESGGNHRDQGAFSAQESLCTVSVDFNTSDDGAVDDAFCKSFRAFHDPRRRGRIGSGLLKNLTVFVHIFGSDYIFADGHKVAFNLKTVSVEHYLPMNAALDAEGMPPLKEKEETSSCATLCECWTKKSDAEKEQIIGYIITAAKTVVTIAMMIAAAV